MSFSVGAGFLARHMPNSLTSESKEYVLLGLAATGIYFQVFCEALLAMLRFSIVALYCVVVFVRVPPELSIILMTGDSSAHLPASDIAYWNCRAGIPSVIQTGISVSLFLPFIIIETFTFILLYFYLDVSQR